ncbi:hypothetical protein OIDMADRAFT_61419 [Oidiodendron maius Zn]|uniref:Uncharacterized protein n=1 Tax=Oidiodendron maius (strain Zn) TaxID=913774 RepID=A0A0C3GCA2_OIDMZ|nr:hypothetical protein OIDMADRAFT_61419 [Oidiodendron maius Zn]
MTATTSSPEQYHLKPTPHVPNSDLPVLVYRNVLPKPYEEDSASHFLEANNWEKRGTWGTIKIRHFHPNSHECYGIFRGQSVLLLGEGHSDASGGERISVSAGDVVVLPAGTAHSSVTSTDDYRYVGVYPKGCPRWRNELGIKPIVGQTMREEVEAVSIPDHDPVMGFDGPLPRLWRMRRNKRVGMAKL